jgi:hypothetical protein
MEKNAGYTVPKSLLEGRVHRSKRRLPFIFCGPLSSMHINLQIQRCFDQLMLIFPSSPEKRFTSHFSSLWLIIFGITILLQHTLRQQIENRVSSHELTYPTWSFCEDIRKLQFFIVTKESMLQKTMRIVWHSVHEFEILNIHIFSLVPEIP